MTTFTEGRHAAEFVLSEANHNRSRDNIVIAASQTIVPGQILVATGVAASITSSAAADAGNTGNGAITLDGSNPVASGAQDGVYRAVCIAVAVNGGTFEVFDPRGIALGKVAVGATFNNQIKFVIADGATDFVAGDAFAITVGVEDTDLQYGALTTAGAGAAKVALPLYGATTGASETKGVSAITRSAEVNGKTLTWPAGITAAVQASVVAALARAGIVVR